MILSHASLLRTGRWLAILLGLYAAGYLLLLLLFLRLAMAGGVTSWPSVLVFLAMAGTPFAALALLVRAGRGPLTPRQRLGAAGLSLALGITAAFWGYMAASSIRDLVRHAITDRIAIEQLLLVVGAFGGPALLGAGLSVVLAALAMRPGPDGDAIPKSSPRG